MCEPKTSTVTWNLVSGWPPKNDHTVLLKICIGIKHKTIPAQWYAPTGISSLGNWFTPEGKLLKNVYPNFCPIAWAEMPE